MRVAVFSARSYDRTFLNAANARHHHELHYREPRLTLDTVTLARGFPAVCAFTLDDLGRDVLTALAAGGTSVIALRCAGYNHVDLAAAGELGLTVVRVPAYSPNAVAEHTLALILALNRKIHRAYARVREGNFTLDGLLGFELRERAVGLVGTGRIGAEVARILAGFGSAILAYDARPNPVVEALGARYLELDELLATADIVSLHLPLTPDTHHLIDAGRIGLMKPGAMLINTSRGALIDTPAVIEALKNGRLGSLGIDVYEEEEDLFFADRSMQVIRDDVFARLLTLPNVIVTAHQAFFTDTAMANIAETTLQNLADIEAGRECPNRLLVA